MGEKDLKIKQFKELLQKNQIVFCDSMIFSYHFHGHPLFSCLTTILFQFLEEEKVSIVTSSASFLEILSFKELEKDKTKLEIIKGFFLLQKNLRIYPLTVEIAQKGAETRRQINIKALDAVQLATTLISKADIFLTNDKDFRNVFLSDFKIIFLSDYL